MAKKNIKLRHPWLDESDPANQQNRYRGVVPGFWVPAPNEIEYECEKTREENKKSLMHARGGIDERRFRREPQQIEFPKQRRELDDEPQICDCPYWGTEFTE